jgi:hypothetical protein
LASVGSLVAEIVLWILPRRRELKLPNHGLPLGFLVAYSFRYLELRLQPFGFECREAGLHLLVFALLMVIIVICFVGFVGMMIVLPNDAGFALGMGWGALALAGLLSVLSIGVGVNFRSKIVCDVRRLRTQGIPTERQLRD